LVPAATVIALLVNPTNPFLAETLSRGLQPAGRAIGQQIRVVSAGTEREIDAAFAGLADARRTLAAASDRGDARFG
jgi:putative tryptophan/tyrosine transport system substrate-binding protein